MQLTDLESRLSSMERDNKRLRTMLEQLAKENGQLRTMLGGAAAQGQMTGTPEGRRCNSAEPAELVTIIIMLLLLLCLPSVDRFLLCLGSAVMVLLRFRGMACQTSASCEALVQVSNSQLHQNSWRVCPRHLTRRRHLGLHRRCLNCRASRRLGPEGCGEPFGPRGGASY